MFTLEFCNNGGGEHRLFATLGNERFERIPFYYMAMSALPIIHFKRERVKLSALILISKERSCAIAMSAFCNARVQIFPNLKTCIAHHYGPLVAITLPLHAQKC